MVSDEVPDLSRMRRERLAKLRAEMERHDVSVLLLLGRSNVTYATGATFLTADAGHATHLRPSAVVALDDAAPHLFTLWPEGAPSELPSDHVHAPLSFETAGDVTSSARRLREVIGDRLRGRVAVDDYTFPLFASFAKAFPGGVAAEAAPILGTAKIRKTADEIECIRRAQSINEEAIADVQAALRPGIRQSDLTGIFLRRIFELGASANALDPVWQVMPASRSAGPWTPNGEVAFPLCSSDRILREGDVLWVDTGIVFSGYLSDFGRAWIVAGRPAPTDRQKRQFERWRQIVAAVVAKIRPGLTGGDVVRAAVDADGSKPWLRHFYLAHGTGTDSAEMPLIGTDLGSEFDESIVLAPGMVLVLEPVIWEDGFGGYRSEEIFAVTETACRQLSHYTYEPFG